IPETLTSLTFGPYFDDMIYPGSLPDSITRITFSHMHNHGIHVDGLPKSLTKLKFGYTYNKTLLVGALPAGLQSLSFGHSFNQSITVGSLPSTLRSLTFGDKFVHTSSIQHWLPSSVTKLKLGKMSALAPGALVSSSLTKLSFTFNYNGVIKHNVLPLTLKYLEFGYMYNQPITRPDVLPPALKSLTFGHMFNQVIGPSIIPRSLKTLIFGQKFNCSLDRGALPRSLTSLTLGASYNRLDTPKLPANLKHLVLGSMDQLIYIDRISHPMQSISVTIEAIISPSDIVVKVPTNGSTLIIGSMKLIFGKETSESKPRQIKDYIQFANKLLKYVPNIGTCNMLLADGITQLSLRPLDPKPSTLALGLLTTTPLPLPKSTIVEEPTNILKMINMR
ncbi:hypothetical protein SAMD00019534_001160, partial [Acytostelium subglobosum LB1]|uniref:hypothetical protein n=1 Tax=Acytostelium subglobosum LB1 TaxID=1410327 RepID=UPI0006449589